MARSRRCGRESVGARTRRKRVGADRPSVSLSFACRAVRHAALRRARDSRNWHDALRARHRHRDACAHVSGIERDGTRKHAGVHGNAMGLAARIRRARRIAGLSQQALANTLGVTRSAVSNWESDSVCPATDRLAILATTLQVGFEWLATGRGDMRLGAGGRCAQGRARRGAARDPRKSEGRRGARGAHRHAAAGGDGHAARAAVHAQSLKM